MKNLITCLVVCVMSGAALAETWTVDDDGKADFNNIEAAVNWASDGDEILVMPGTYTGSGSHAVEIINKAIWLHSLDGPEVTIIDGELAGRTGIKCVNSGNDEFETIIDGFTIQNCYWPGWGGGVKIENCQNISINNCLIKDNSAAEGAGMYCRDSYLTISNCEFRNNNTASSGGGVWISISAASFSYCQFENNHSGGSGGGAYISSNNSLLTQSSFVYCSFNNNTAGSSGGGLCNSNSSPTISGCVFMSNSAVDRGGGMGNMQANYPSNSAVISCSFIDNTADEGGGVYNGYNYPSFTECNFTSNTANNDGGGMYNDHCNPILTDCTFEDNTTINWNGGGMWCYNSNPIITNCAFKNNVTADFGGGLYNISDGETSPTLENTTICGNTPDQIYGDWTNDGGNTIADECPNCPADLDNDGEVRVTDLLILISAWGPCSACPEDMNGDDVVDVTDLLILIGAWGTCP